MRLMAFTRASSGVPLRLTDVSLRQTVFLLRPMVFIRVYSGVPLRLAGVSLIQTVFLFENDGVH
jgi:hypothetical protein